jgi:lipoprotein-releasing system ATP-binding protein
MRPVRTTAGGKAAKALKVLAEPVVQVSALSKSYANIAEELSVFSEVSFSVPVGGSLAIVGESGSGKSTLLNLIGGLDYPSTGTVRVFSQQIEIMNETELAEFRNKHIGFVFQYHHLLPDFSALENVALPALVAGRSQEEAFADALALLQDIGLGGRADHRPGSLSGGEQQRVAIARALVNKPGLVLMDEPTGNLDERTGKIVLSLVRNLQRWHSLTLIIVTHSPAVSAACNHCLRLAHGRAVMRTGSSKSGA